MRRREDNFSVDCICTEMKTKAVQWIKFRLIKKHENITQGAVYIFTLLY